MCLPLACTRCLRRLCPSARACFVLFLLQPVHFIPDSCLAPFRFGFNDSYLPTRSPLSCSRPPFRFVLFQLHQLQTSPFSSLFLSPPSSPTLSFCFFIAILRAGLAVSLCVFHLAASFQSSFASLLLVCWTRRATILVRDPPGERAPPFFHLRNLTYTHLLLLERLRRSFCSFYHLERG